MIRNNVPTKNGGQIKSLSDKEWQQKGRKDCLSNVMKNGMWGILVEARSLAYS